MPVSFIQKYLVKKLDLDSETEVCSSLLPYSNIISLLVYLLKIAVIFICQLYCRLLALYYCL